MASRNLPPIERLRQLFRYDENSGNLIWQSRPRSEFECDWDACRRNERWANQPLARCGKTYIDGVPYRASRIIKAFLGIVDAPKASTPPAPKPPRPVPISRTFSVEYRTWKGMHNRCKPSGYGTEYHGAMGVRVCERWNDFTAFIEDMGPRPSAEHSIDRFPDPFGHYAPENCRWATRSEQARNTRRKVVITVCGVSRHLVEWAELCGISRQAMFARFRSLSPEESVCAYPQMPAWLRAKGGRRVPSFDPPRKSVKNVTVVQGRAIELFRARFLEASAEEIASAFGLEAAAVKRHLFLKSRRQAINAAKAGTYDPKVYREKMLRAQVNG